MFETLRILFDKPDDSGGAPPVTPPANDPPVPTPNPSGQSGGVTFTPEQQELLNKRLADERRDAERRVRESDEVKALRQKATEYDKLAESQKTETQKLADRLAALEQENQTLKGTLTQREREALRARVAAKHKLPDELAARITGETEEDMDKDAAGLAKLIAPPKAPDTDAGKGTTPNGDGKAPGPEQKRPYRFQQPGDIAW